jgi:hypothetical protein
MSTQPENPTPYTLHPKPLHPTPYTINSNSWTRHSKPHARNTQHSTLNTQPRSLRTRRSRGAFYCMFTLRVDGHLVTPYEI